MDIRALDKHGRPFESALTRREVMATRDALPSPKPPVTGTAGLVPPREDWFDRAACLGAGAEAFFPTRDDVTASPPMEEVAAAKAVCARCPVTAECYELWRTMPATHRQYGVWFGTSPSDRRRGAA